VINGFSATAQKILHIKAVSKHQKGKDHFGNSGM